MEEVECCEEPKTEVKEENTNENFKCESSELDDDEENCRYVVSIVTKINGLAHFGHFQAQEAEMRAENAISLAERSINEALSVRELSEHLTKTARDVTDLVTDFLSRTKIPINLPALQQDIENIYEHEVSNRIGDKLRRLRFSRDCSENAKNVRFSFEGECFDLSTSDNESNNPSELSDSSNDPATESDENQTNVECGAGDRASPAGQCVDDDKTISAKDKVDEEIGKLDKIDIANGDTKDEALACGHAFV